MLGCSPVARIILVIVGLMSEGDESMNLNNLIATMSVTHSGVRYRVLNHVTPSFPDALVCAFALSQDDGQPYTIDVMVSSESGAIHYAGDEGANWFQTRTSDVYETIVISATVQPGGN